MNEEMRKYLRRHSIEDLIVWYSFDGEECFLPEAFSLDTFRGVRFPRRLSFPRETVLEIVFDADMGKFVDACTLYSYSPVRFDDDLPF